MVDKNPKLEFDYNELETMLEDELPRDEDCSNINPVNGELHVNNIKN